MALAALVSLCVTRINFYTDSHKIAPTHADGFILRGMGQVRNLLRVTPWGLPQARILAQEIGDYKPSLRALIRELFGENIAVRKRAADVARRITDEDASRLHRYADELAGLLESLPVFVSHKQAEKQTRWHLALVVSRVAHTQAQRLRAARIMSLLVEDNSNALRCAAMEGMATLALNEPSLLPDAEALVEQFLWNGTPAMKARARHMQKRLMKKYAER